MCLLMECFSFKRKEKYLFLWTPKGKELSFICLCNLTRQNSWHSPCLINIWTKFSILIFWVNSVVWICCKLRGVLLVCSPCLRCIDWCAQHVLLPACAFMLPSLPSSLLVGVVHHLSDISEFMVCLSGSPSEAVYLRVGLIHFIIHLDNVQSDCQ